MAKPARKASAAKPTRDATTTAGWPAAFRWQAPALALLVLLAYWNSLGASFHFDDWSLLSDPDVAGPGLGLRLFRLGLTRPLTYWSFHLNFLAGGSDTATLGFHLVSVFLHLANCVLVLWIARRHLPPPAAFLAAGLFATHPLQTEAVSYIFARSSLLSTFFALLCFALFLKRRYRWSAAAFAFSLLAKEEAVALPALLLLYDYLFISARDRREAARRKWYYAGLLGMVVLAAARLFYVLKTWAEPGVGFDVRGISPVVYALTQARVVWRYLGLVALPINQNLDYDIPLSRSLVSPPITLVALIALAALLAGLFILLKGDHKGRPCQAVVGAGLVPARHEDRHIISFWALGFFLLLAPSSSIVAQSDVMYEHRTYLPMASLVIALALLLARAFDRLPGGSARTAIVWALLAVSTVTTMARNEVWAGELSLWRDVVSKSPNKGRPYIGLSRGYFQNNQAGAARQALERGLRLDPSNRELQMNVGVASLQAGDGQAALEHFQRALELGRETPEVWNNLGAADSLLGERDKAIDAYRRALTLSPCFYNSRRNLMTALAEQGRIKEALETGSLPASCRLVPQQQQELEQYRNQLAAGGRQ